MLQPFEEIYQAAQAQDNSALTLILRHACIDTWKQGGCYHSAATQLAIDGERTKAEWLLSRGANINYVALGAALGRHQDYAEALLSRGADINWLAQGAALGGYQDYAEALLSRGSNINDVARGAALGGHQDYAEDLLSRGANINHVARGAALGGHQDFAEDLLSRGADINDVARGAALGGDQDFAEALLNRGADINWLARGAALGGHQDFAEALLSHGADINFVARGAALGGHQDFAEDLLRRGADINDVAWGAAFGAHITSNKLNQLRYLSYYSPKHVQKLIAAFSSLEKPIAISDEITQRAICMSSYIHHRKLSYSQALARTERTKEDGCEGALYLWMFLSTSQTNTPVNNNKKELKNLPLELWYHIFEFVTPEPLTTTELNNLGFFMQRAYCCAQLLSYQNASHTYHKNRAYHFLKAVYQTQSEDELAELVDKQVELLEGKNPYPLSERDANYKFSPHNSTPDKFHGIIQFWHKKLSNVDIYFEVKKPSSFTIS